MRPFLPGLIVAAWSVFSISGASPAFGFHPGPDHGEVQHGPFPEPSEEGWELFEEKDGNRLYRGNFGDNGIIAFRGVRTIDAPIARVAEVYLDGEGKKEWVDRAVGVRIIELISLQERWEHMTMNSPWPFQDREFVYHAILRADPVKKRLFISLRSGEHPDQPRRGGSVRANVIRNYYWFTSVNDGKSTEVIMEGQVDPGGVIPNWITNMIQKNWAKKTYRGVERRLENPEVKENAGVRRLLGLPPL